VLPEENLPRDVEAHPASSAMNRRGPALTTGFLGARTFLLLADGQALAEQPVLPPAYAGSGAAPGDSSGALSTAGKTLQVAW
jgi:hypothetical protein